METLTVTVIAMLSFIVGCICGGIGCLYFLEAMLEQEKQDIYTQANQVANAPFYNQNKEKP